MALGATIVLYNIPDLSDQSIFDAYQTIIETNAVDIANSSFGGPEGIFTADYDGGTDFTGILRMFDDLIGQGNAQGITFVGSSGDKRRTLSAFARIFQWTESGCLPARYRRCRTSLRSAGTNLVTFSSAISLQSAYVSENAFG